MSVAVLFNFSSGLARDLVVPAGTLRRCREHVVAVEEALSIRATRYRDNPAHWTPVPWREIDTRRACEVVEKHNAWVERLYEHVEAWAREAPAGETETMTPADAATFWHGTQTINVPPEHWSRDYFVRRMGDAYEVMRGRPAGRLTWPGGKGGEPLRPRQAANVLWLLSQLGYDPSDMRLDVPRGCDHVASSYDGGYEWCETCGAVEHETGADCQRRGCAYRRRLREEGRDA